MTCPKCNSNNVNATVVNEVSLKNKGKGVLYYLFVWWWWAPIKWLVFTLPALIIAIFKPKKQKAINKQKTVCVCQDCGYTWNA